MEWESYNEIGATASARTAGVRRCWGGGEACVHGRGGRSGLRSDQVSRVDRTKGKFNTHRGRRPRLQARHNCIGRSVIRRAA